MRCILEIFGRMQQQNRPRVALWAMAKRMVRMLFMVVRSIADIARFTH